MAEAPKKSDRTRSAITRAARALFARQGYDRTTVREIAARAKIDPALVIRYFGSKEQLFALVARFDLNLPDLAAVDRSAIGASLARHYIDLWDGESGLPVLLRSAASNDHAAGHLREVFRAQVMPMIAKVPAKLPAAERAGLVASQLLGMALCRYVLKMPPLTAMPKERLVDEIGRTIQRYITGED